MSTLVITAAALVLIPAELRSEDAPPVDMGQLLQALRAMKEQQVVQVKGLRRKALQEAQTAASSGAAALAAWEEAVRQTQFEGAAREGSQFREWKSKEGEALEEKEAQSALRLYFSWLGLTLQRASGVTVKELLPQVIAYTKELTADDQMLEALKDKIAHEKDLAGAGNHPHAGAKAKSKDLEEVKKMHDSILSRGLAASPPVQAWRLGTIITVPEWENSPGNNEGIFEKIILPQLRADRDPRLLEYWDMKLKRETEAAAKSKLAFDNEKFVQNRRPELLWKRAQDQLVIGQKNRALSEMFNLIKNYPNHPGAADWLSKLEAMLGGLEGAPGSASGATSGAAAASGPSGMPGKQ